MNGQTYSPWKNTTWSPAGGGSYVDPLDMFLSEDQKPKSVGNSKNLVWDPVTKTFVPRENGPVGPSPWAPDTSRDGFGRVPSATRGIYKPGDGLSSNQRVPGAFNSQPFSGLGQSGGSFGNLKPRRPFR